MLDTLKFDERGLIPAIVQDYFTKRVLTLAYMNRESLEITLREGRTCFWSRSRGQLWRKGETSGNFQKVIRVTADCDRDALVIEVRAEGPACHLGGESCFAFPLLDTEEKGAFSIETLYSLLADRDVNRPQGSYTTYLFEKGREKILKKVGEECSEVIIAAMKGEKEELIAELSDLCYHAVVLMVSEGVTLEDIRTRLAFRHVIDKKIKQETES